MENLLLDALRRRDSSFVMKLLVENNISRQAILDLPGAVPEGVKYWCDAESPQGNTPLILAAGYNNNNNYYYYYYTYTYYYYTYYYYYYYYYTYTYYYYYYDYYYYFHFN